MRILAALVVAALVSLPRALTAQTQAGTSGPPPLLNISKALVAVTLAADKAQGVISLDRIRTFLELRLREAGLRVLSPDEDRADPDINPVVFASIVILPLQTRGGVKTGYTFSMMLRVEEWRVSPRNGALGPLILWEDQQIETEGYDADIEASAEHVLGSQLDEMLNEWLKANPRRD